MNDSDDDYFDLDAVAAEYRSKRVPFRFTFRGREWQLSNLFATVDLDTIESAQSSNLGALRTALTSGLGADADDFKVGTLTVVELVPLFERWSVRSGSAPGESEASSDSSGNTGRPSKRTSKPSTGSSSAKRSTGPRKSAAPRANS